MQGLSDFFKRVQNSFTKELFLRGIVRDAIKKIANIEIAVEDISFKGESVFVSKLNSSAKTALFIKKQDILKELNEIQKLRIIKDIR